MTETDTTTRSGIGRYAEVNGLRMYHEVHGDLHREVPPLLLLHGGFSDLHDTFGDLLPAFAATRPVIGVEQQGHGHTADIDRAMTFAQMADDTAALLRHLGVDRADVFGYSDGGVVGLGLAIRHPDLVRKLAIAGAQTANHGLDPEVLGFLEAATVDDFDVMREAYEAVAPHPAHWPELVRKANAATLTFPGWTEEEVRGITTPTLVMIGDADIIRPEHAVETFRLLAHGQLAVLPGTDHVALIHRIDWLRSMITDFLAAPMPSDA